MEAKAKDAEKRGPVRSVLVSASWCSVVLWPCVAVLSRFLPAPLQGRTPDMEIGSFVVGCVDAGAMAYGTSGVVFFVAASVRMWRALARKFGGKDRNTKAEPALILIGLTFFVLPFSFALVRSCSAVRNAHGSVLLDVASRSALCLSPVAFAGAGLLVSAGIFSLTSRHRRGR